MKATELLMRNFNEIFSNSIPSSVGRCSRRVSPKIVSGFILAVGRRLLSG
jgi:hypothetical protein